MGKAKQPSGWTPVKLSRIIKKIDSGVSANGDGRPASCAEVGVLKVSAVTSGRFEPTQNKVVLEPSEKERLKCSVKSGDILMTRANGSADLVGACVYARSDHPNLFLSDKIWKFIIDDTERDHSEWLYYLLSSAPLRQQIIDASSGSVGMRNVSKEGLLGISVARPPYPEQQKIAAILSTWDRGIELTEKLIAAKQKRKQALMQKLLTGKVRFKEFEGKPWSRVPLGKLLKEVKRFVDWSDNAEYHLLSIRRRSGGMFDRETKVGHEIKTKVMMITETGDFVIARMQAVHGAIAVTPPGCHGKHVSGSYSTFILKDPSKLHMPFLNYVSQTLAFYRLLLLSAYGVTIEKMTFNLPWFLSEKIDLPPTLVEQKRIADVFVAFDDENKLLIQRLEKLNQQKKGLMQQLLTGKIRVALENLEGSHVKC